MIPRFMFLSTVTVAACVVAISGLHAAPPHERRAPLLNPSSQQTLSEGRAPFVQPVPMNDPYAGNPYGTPPVPPSAPPPVTSYGAPPELYDQTPPPQPRDYMPPEMAAPPGQYPSPDVAAMSPTGTIAGPGVDPGTMPVSPSEFMQPDDVRMGTDADTRRRPVLQEALPSIPPAYTGEDGAVMPPPVMQAGHAPARVTAEPDEERLHDIVSQPAYQPHDITPPHPPVTYQSQGYVRDEVPRDQVKTSLWSDFFDFSHEPGDRPDYPTLADTPPAPQDMQAQRYQADVQELQQERDAMLAMRGEPPVAAPPPMSDDPMMTQAEAAMFDPNVRRRPAGMREGPFGVPAAPTASAAPTADVQSEDMAPLMPPAPEPMPQVEYSSGAPVQMPERAYVPPQQHASIPETAPAAGMPYGYTENTPQMTVAPPPRILGTVGGDMQVTPADVRARPYNPAAATNLHRPDVPLQPRVSTLPESRYAARRSRRSR